MHLLLTFPNVFAHTQFKDLLPELLKPVKDVKYIPYTTVYGELIHKYNYINVRVLKDLVPEVKIVEKVKQGKKVKYIKL